MKIQNMHGEVVDKLPDSHTVIFETPAGRLFVMLGADGHDVVVAAEDGKHVEITERGMASFRVGVTE